MLEPGKNYPGGVPRVITDFTDSDGVAVDPSTVTFRLMAPGCVEYSYVYGTDSELTRLEAGRYQMLVSSTVTECAGRYRYRWETTGAITASEGSFIVQASAFFDPCCGDYA